MMTFSAIRGAQIIDITKECTFEWGTEPDSIISGTFPDSFMNDDINEYLEVEAILGGAGSKPNVTITIPKVDLYLSVLTLGVGERVDASNDPLRCVYTYTQISNYYMGSKVNRTHQVESGRYDGIMNESSAMPFGYFNQLIFRFYASSGGTFRYRIHNVKIFKLII